MLNFRFLCLFLWFCALDAYAERTKDKLPIEAFASLPSYSHLNISPDGKRLAYIQNSKGDLLLSVLDIDANTVKLIVKTDNLKVRINWFDWVNDDLLIIGTRSVFGENNNYVSTHLLKYDFKKGKGVESVIRARGFENQPQFEDRVLSMLPDDPEHILLLVDLARQNVPNVYKLNVNTGKHKRVQKNIELVSSWGVDRQGRVRTRTKVRDTKVYIEFKSLESGDWNALFEYEAFSTNAVEILGFDSEPNTLFFKAIHKDKKSIFKVDLTDPKLTRELVFHDAKYDVDGRLHYSQKTGKVIGFSHSQIENGIQYWDTEYLQHQAALDQVLTDSLNYIIDTDREENRYIIYSEAKDFPGGYLIGDKKKNSVEYFANRYPLIGSQNYIGKTKVKYLAQDQTEIEAYITFPKNYKKGEKHPAIIIPHGGPMSRDYAGFDYWSEFFAHHGYLVFQPNFRGSSGYGHEFESKAIGDWGGVMQDDLEDGAQWLVSKGYAIKNKMCIAGASYGGYASLMALVKYPETFQCSVSFAGVSDLEFLYARAFRYTNTKFEREYIGRDLEKLKNTSPVNFAKKITKPLLLLHGTKDTVVPFEHSLRMAAAMKSENKDVKFLHFEGGGHHLAYQKYRIRALAEMLAFFDKHLM